MYKVLYICPSSGLGGAETFIKQTFSQADKSNYQNHYLLFETGPLFDYLESQGARVHLLSQPPCISKWCDHKTVHEELRKTINENNIDVVHSSTATGAIFAAWTCKQMKTPHVWFQHGLASGWQDRLASILPHNGLIANSHYTGQKQRALENPLRFLIPRENPIEKILLGTDITEPEVQTAQSHRAQLLKEHALPEDTIIISMISRIERWKGIHLLLDSLNQLKSENIGQNFYCFIWGNSAADNNYKSELERTISNQNLPAKLMGVSPDVSLSLSASDIVVNASTEPEPFGLSIIEGMMMGAIPVVPDEGGPLEIVSNGKDGLFFKARQTASLTKNLKTLILDSELRDKLSLEAKNTAQNKYNASRAINHLETFYQKVLS